MRAEDESLTEIFEENQSKSWTSNLKKKKETHSLDNIRVTSRTEPIVNCQEGQNIRKIDHKRSIHRQARKSKIKQLQQP